MLRKEIVVSGLRPTGNLHLGNYFGALSQFVQMQDTYPCYFFIADDHALTTHPSSLDMRQNIIEILAEYIALGIDPEKVTLYLQSDVPQVSELYLLLNMNAYLGELERVASFKEKVRKQPENINAGLLTYPVLMAADILLHKAALVPVGKDQEQHLEMCRTFARRFNRIYNKEFFPEPQAFSFSKTLIKIPGLDGSGKMGKSEGENNAIFLRDDPEIIRKKIMRAVSDSGPTEQNQKKPEPVQNLFVLLKHLSSPETCNYFEEQYNTCKIRYGDLKKQLAEDIVSFFEPVREKIKTLSSRTDYLNKIIKLGAEKASKSADETLKEVRDIMGLGISKR
jgi:tryptophanyl-tRNA synthetase